jgi:hypothetical protein
MKLIRIWLVRICGFNFFQGRKGMGYSLTDIWYIWKNYQSKRSKQVK